MTGASAAETPGAEIGTAAAKTAAETGDAAAEAAEAGDAAETGEAEAGTAAGAGVFFVCSFIAAFISWTLALASSLILRLTIGTDSPFLFTATASNSTTLPSSSMSILAPDSAWMPLMTLPPGPMSAPIFSGSMCVRMSRGAYCEMSS